MFVKTHSNMNRKFVIKIEIFLKKNLEFFLPETNNFFVFCPLTKVTIIKGCVKVQLHQDTDKKRIFGPVLLKLLILHRIFCTCCFLKLEFR